MCLQWKIPPKCMKTALCIDIHSCYFVSLKCCTWPSVLAQTVSPAGSVSRSFNHLDLLTVLALRTAGNDLWRLHLPIISHRRSPQHSVNATMWSSDVKAYSTKDHRLCSIQAKPGVSGCGRNELSLLVWRWIPAISGGYRTTFHGPGQLGHG